MLDGELAMPLFDRLDRDLSVLMSDRGRFRRLPRSWARSLRDRLRVASVSGGRLDFLLEWGLGSNVEWGQEDSNALQNALNITNAVSRLVACDAVLTLIVTDTHAAINGLPQSEWREYANSVSSNAAQQGVATEMLSGVLGNSLYETSHECLDLFIDREAAWDSLTPFQCAELKARASRRSLQGDPQIAAKLYVQASLVEGVKILARWPGAIGLTYHTPNFGFLVPPLPTIFMFVEPGRVVGRPWFRHHSESYEA